MKNIFYILLLICSTNVFAQSGIVTDELFLKYEKAYTEYVNSRKATNFQNLDKMESDFYKSFKDIKALKSFQKSKKPAQWLEKNISKLTYSTVAEAVKSYNDISDIKEQNLADAKVHTDLLDQLLKKYDKQIIWDALKSRLPK